MRRKYLKFIYRGFRGRRFSWVSQQFIKYLLTSFSILDSKPYTGPFLVTINPTRRCNLRCKMCNISQSENADNSKELTLDEIKKLIDDLKELKVEIISLSGGEIFLRKDIFEIIEYVKMNKIFLNLSTNGTLITRDVAKKIAELEVDSTTISLDGANAKTHDSIRNVSGSYKKVIKALENLSEICNDSNTFIDVVTVISNDNLHEIPDIINLVEKLGLNSIGFIPFHDSVDKKIKYVWNEQKINEVVEKIISVKKKGGVIDNSETYLKQIRKFLNGEEFSWDCGAGYITCVIDSNGDIFPCYRYLDMGRSIGNIRNVDIKDFWFSSEYNNIRKKLFSCRECLWNCQHELNISFRFSLLLKSLFNRLKVTT